MDRHTVRKIDELGEKNPRYLETTAVRLKTVCIQSYSMEVRGRGERGKREGRERNEERDRGRR